MPINSTVSAIADVLKTIIYDNSTLGDLGLVKKYPDTNLEEYGCEVQVYFESANSKDLDNTANRRTLTINIDILSHGADKQEQGIENLNELTEKVMEKMEKFLPKIGGSVPNPMGIVVKNTNLQTSKLQMVDGKFMRRLVVEVFEYVSSF